MRLAYAAGAPQVEVVGRGIKVLAAIERELTSGGDLVTFYGELTIRFRAAEEPQKRLLQRLDAGLVRLPGFDNQKTNRTEAVSQLASPHAGSGQGSAAQENGRNPLPGQIA